MESKLDHSKFAKCCGSTMYLQLAFVGLHKVMMENGMNVEEVNLTEEGEKVVTELSFRQSLMQIASAPFNTGALSKEENDTLNAVTVYLATPMETEKPDELTNENKDVITFSKPEN
jgi:hypothetical protein